MSALHRVVLGLPCVAALLPAQNQHQSRGLLAGSPTAVLVDGGLAAGDDAQTRVHRSGFAAGPTLALPPGPAQPDLRAILQPFGLTPAIDVDDLSTGRDEVLVHANGFVAVPPSSWSVWSFSLRQGAVGAAGSRIAQEASLGNVGAALFSWVLPSLVLPPQVQRRTERSHSAADLGLPAGVELDGVDVPIVLGREQGGLASTEPGFGPLGAQVEAVFFTVSSASVAPTPDAWWQPYSESSAGSGATILVTRRDAAGAWLPPRVYLAWWELGFAPTEDIDALAVDEPAQKALVSMVGTTRDQFLVVDHGTDGTPAPAPVRTADGTPVSQQIGKAQNDDVDAVCTLDPVLGTAMPESPHLFGSSCGAPRPGLLGVPSVHASAFRRRQGGQTFFDSWLVGWPPSTGVTAGLAVPFATIEDDMTLLPLGPIQLRDVLDPRPGNPLVVSLPMPAGFSLSGTRITFRWVAVDAAFSELAEAWPVQVFL